MPHTSERTDLTSYLLGERSELRALIEAISVAGDDEARQRAALEYLLVLATARLAASGEPPEARALAQVRAQYTKVFTHDESEHASLIKELHSSLHSGVAVSVLTALKLLALFHRKNARYELARASFAVASRLADRIGDPLEMLNALFWLGVAERYLGHLERAEEVHNEQLGLARKFGQSGQAVLAQENLGLVALRRGQVGEARKRVMRALNEAQQLEDQELQGYCHHALMLVETEAGRPGEAASFGWEAYTRYESVDQRLRALQDCAVILYESGIFDAAEAAWEIILDTAKDSATMIRCKIGLIDIATQLEQQERFAQLAADVMDEPRLASMPLELLEAHRSVGLGYVAFGEVDRARIHLMRGLAVARDNGYESEASQISDTLRDLTGGVPRIQPTDVPEGEVARLEDVGRSIKAEWERRCA